MQNRKAEPIQSLGWYRRRTGGYKERRWRENVEILLTH
jgi:hypothetical protein